MYKKRSAFACATCKRDQKYWPGWVNWNKYISFKYGRCKRELILSSNIGIWKQNCLLLGLLLKSEMPLPWPSLSAVWASCFEFCIAQQKLSISLPLCSWIWIELDRPMRNVYAACMRSGADMSPRFLLGPMLKSSSRTVPIARQGNRHSPPAAMSWSKSGLSSKASHSTSCTNVFVPREWP